MCNQEVLSSFKVYGNKVCVKVYNDEKPMFRGTIDEICEFLKTQPRDLLFLIYVED